MTADRETGCNCLDETTRACPVHTPKLAELMNKRRAAAPVIEVQDQAFVTKDSGAREEYGTGARRDVRVGKGRYDLMSTVATRRDAQLLERGAVKYGDRNWEKGMPISRFLDSALRHIFNYLEGECTEDHLAAARWNLGCAMHMEEKIPEMQDVPTRPGASPKSSGASSN